VQTKLLEKLTRAIIEQRDEIEQWLQQQWQLTPPPITCSVDLRNAQFKLAPVDANLFPAGFNNLSATGQQKSIAAFQQVIQQHCTHAKNILILPESHSRHLFYYENVATLQYILQQAGYDVRVGSLLNLNKPHNIDLPSGKQVLLEPVQRIDNKLALEDFHADFVLLNNDLSDGVPEILRNLQQPIRPRLSFGWTTRLKSMHFAHYANVVNELADKYQFDSWLINPLFRYCGKVNFLKREGEACLLKNADALFTAIREKYHQYQISDQPYIMVKADRGTYGMGILRVEDPQQLISLSRKQRNQMAAIKGSRSVSEVILQEGVYTADTFTDTNASAEPVIYLVGANVVGGFYRYHPKQSKSENLNAPGMQFAPIPDHLWETDDKLYVYSVIARLSLLAAARELQELGYDN
jgi:glutamate--cysteine ligase